MKGWWHREIGARGIRVVGGVEQYHIVIIAQKSREV